MSVQVEHDNEVTSLVPTAVDSGPQVVQPEPGPSRLSLRADFGAHLEANYQRLVAQLYAITLDSGEAHDAVQDAYSRAWRQWSEIGRADATAWIRRVAVRSTHSGWRRLLGRVGLTRARAVADGGDPRTVAVLAALARLSIEERRTVVLFHMVGMSRTDIAALEQESTATIRQRLGRAHQVVSEGMADELPSVLGIPSDPHDHRYPQEERPPRWTP